MQPFDAILHEHGAMLSRIISSYEADRALKDELMQEVALAIWQALPRFRGEGSVRAFLARICHNRCITHVSKAVKAPKSVDISAELESGGPGPEEQALKAQRREKLMIAMRRLPVGQRQVMTLALEGFSHQEIGAAVGITENNVGVRLNRAKAALTDMLAGGSA